MVKMRYLTLAEVNEQHGGILPPDACLRADSEPDPARTPATSRTSPRGQKRARKANPVVRKVRGYARFFEVLPTLKPVPSPGAVALWCWLWTCERSGRARTSVRKLAERFGSGRDTVRRRLAELAALGLIQCLRPGRRDRSPSIYRVCTGSRMRPPQCPE